MSDLFSKQRQMASEAVECLGQVFPNNEARRQHFLSLLSEHLKNPAFHNIEGFPVATNEAILALSDPPYYTACPNPFIAEFIQYYGKEYDSHFPSVVSGECHRISAISQ